jgi:hypothetical protein
MDLPVPFGKTPFATRRLEEMEAAEASRSCRSLEAE